MTTASDLDLHVHADTDATAAAAAALVAGHARDAVARRQVFTLALSGGRTPASMLRALAAQDVPWERVHLFQADERVAPAGDAARNVNMVHRALGGDSPMSAATLHAMPVEDDDLETAAGRYAGALAAVAGREPVLDLVHLGLGDDGHTASLVPGDRALAVTDTDVCLSSEYRGHRRMTLTFPIINRARCRLWLATGADKGAMLARLQAADAEIPAGHVARAGTVVFCDADAARAAGLAG